MWFTYPHFDEEEHYFQAVYLVNNVCKLLSAWSCSSGEDVTCWPLLRHTHSEPSQSTVLIR